MSVDILKKQLKENKFASVYLLYGEEHFLRDYYFQQLKDKLIDENLSSFNYMVFSGKSIDLSQVWDAIESLPVMAQRKMIVIKDSGALKAAKPDVKEFWENNIPDIPKHACVVFNETEIDKRNKVYQLIKKHGVPVEFNYPKKIDLVNWVGKIVASYNKSIEKQDIYYLLEYCDAGMINIKNEVEKLIYYCYDKKSIKRQDIDRICIKSIESKVFQMIDAVMENNLQLAFELLNDMMILKESGVKILTLMAKQFSGMLKVKLLSEKGMSSSEIAKRMDIAPFITKKYIQHAQNFTKQYIQQAMQECLNADTDIKSGRAKEWPVIQMLIAQHAHK